MTEDYDAIVIGGGHNGLTASLDLARAGWSVLLLEAQAAVGGCATTVDSCIGGFRYSPHANCFLFADIMPDRIAPRTLRVPMHQPEAQLGVAFADGRPPVILHRPDLLSRTVESFAAYSRKDGATYAELKRRSAPLGAVIRNGLYHAPDPQWFAGQADAVRKAYKGHCGRGALGQGSARTLIDELFEAPEVRILLYHLATETGVGLEERGSDIAFLGYSLWIAGRWRLPLGGMGAYAEALREAAIASGVRIAESTPARRIMVEAGRAVGVETADGAIIGASRAVLAAVPLLDMFDALLDAEAIAPGMRDALAAFRRQRPGSIASTVFCLAGQPRYKSARYDPDIDACLKTVAGHESPADVLEQQADLRAGLLPRPAGVVRVHSLWDPAQAPQGRHIAVVDSNFPATDIMDADKWNMVEAAFPQAFLDMWASYRSDRADPPLAMSCDLSSSFERRMLMKMGAAQYRGGLEGLYLAGPGIYPGGGVHGACGANAAHAVLTDHRVHSKTRSAGTAKAFRR